MAGLGQGGRRREPLAWLQSWAQFWVSSQLLLEAEGIQALAAGRAGFES